MKYLIGCAFIVLASLNCLAQTKMSKEQFLSLNSSQKELYLRVKKSDSLKTIKINEYLSVNDNAQRSFVDEKGTLYVLSDIILGKPIYKSTFNEDAAIATGTNHLQVGGDLGLDLDGAGLTVGVWDGGPVQNTHTEFQDYNNTFSRVTVMENLDVDGNTGFDSHGTHVAGTISARGVVPSAKGMATAVLVKSYNYNNDTPEMIIAATDINDPIFLSNHSYGVPINQGSGQLDPWMMGAYTNDAREIDDIARNNPKYLIVASAGNSGSVSYTGGLYPNYDKLTTDKNAKNNLVVANASPSIHPFTGEVTFQINQSSSQGPTDDLRIKPDIAGDGTGLYSPIPMDSYATYSGTSMAAPNVTGSLLLLQEYYFQLYGEFMNSSTLKGLVCHTAVDDNTYIGPDPIFGWGLLDAKTSAETILASSNDLAIIDELTLDNGGNYTFNFSAQAGEKLSATLCWTDVRGVSVSGGSSLNDQTPRLVNDLDIRIVKDGVAFLPWKLDYSPSIGFTNSKADNNVDNVERIDIDIPESGNYTLVVSHKGALQASQPFDPLTQDFSLILTGNNLTLSTDDYELSSTKVWPNPSNDVINVSYNLLNSKAASLEIYDIQGRKVYEDTISTSNSEITKSIDVSDFYPGTYILSIKDGINVFNQKIVVN